MQALTYIERGSTVALVLATARALRGLVYIAVHRQVLDISNLARAEAREINALGKITDNKSAFERETAITSVALLKVCTHHWAAMSNERVNPTVGRKMLIEIQCLSCRGYHGHSELHKASLCSSFTQHTTTMKLKCAKD